MKRLFVLSFSLVFTTQTIFAEKIRINTKENKTTTARKKNVTPDYMEIPFKLVNGLVILTATIDDEVGNFIFDSGSPQLVLNEARLKNRAMKINNQKSIGITGTVSDEKKLWVDAFRWNDYRKYRFYARAFDLSHLEAVQKIPIHGLIGYKVFSNYEVLFDYPNRQLTFYKLDRKGNRLIEENNLPLYTANFEKRQHFAIIKAQAGNQTLKLAIDSGAQLNILGKKRKRQTAAQFTNLQQVNIHGTGSKAKTANSGRFREMKIGGVRWLNMRTTFSDMRPLNYMYNMKIDGLLGYEFLSIRKISINYKKRQIYIWSDIDLDKQSKPSIVKPNETLTES